MVLRGWLSVNLFRCGRATSSDLIHVGRCRSHLIHVGSSNLIDVGAVVGCALRDYGAVEIRRFW